MNNNRLQHVKYPPLYQKALELLSMSRSMSYVFGQDLINAAEHNLEHEKIYFTGDIIQQSYSLAPEILRAENQPYAEDKKRYAQQLKLLTKKLFLTCDQLENSPIKSKDFLSLFRKELRQFLKLQRTWTLML